MKKSSKIIIAIALLFIGVNNNCASTAATPPPADDYIVVDSIQELLTYISQDDLKIRLKPKVYDVTLEDKELVKIREFIRYRDGVLLDVKLAVAVLLDFSGSNNTIDFTGSTIKIDSRLFGACGKQEFADALISGNDNYIKGLKMIDYGNQAPTVGLNSLYIRGDRNTITNSYIFAEGSTPYGYGHLLGKGGTNLVQIKKHCGILIAGIDTKFLKNTLVIHGYGHGIYLQGAHNTWIEDCVVEGKMRSTDDMLKETSGPAFDTGFESTYHPGYIVPGEMKALSEDAYRIYATGSNGRKTVGLNVVNCKAIRMRTGFDVSLGTPSGDLKVIGCEAIECQFGYSLNSGAIVEKCKGDIKYGPVLTFPYLHAEGSKVEIEITNGESKEFSYVRAAEINGSNHDITFTASKGMTGSIPIAFGDSFRCDVAMFRTPTTKIEDVSGATNVKLKNMTPLPVVVNKRSSNCEVTSIGTVKDDGNDTTITKQ